LNVCFIEQPISDAFSSVLQGPTILEAVGSSKGSRSYDSSKVPSQNILVAMEASEVPEATVILNFIEFFFLRFCGFHRSDPLLYTNLHVVLVTF
jgi:hypothetical protein